MFIIILTSHVDVLVFVLLCTRDSRGWHLRTETCKKVQESHYRLRQTLRVPGGSRSQTSRQSAHEGGKDVSPMHRPPLPPPGNIPGTHFCHGLSQLQGRSVAGRIMSMKNSNHTIRNRTRDLPACSTVPQPTAPQHAPPKRIGLLKLMYSLLSS